MKGTALSGLLVALSHSLMLNPCAHAQTPSSSDDSLEVTCRKGIGKWIESGDANGFDLRLTRFRVRPPKAATGGASSQPVRAEEFSVSGRVWFRPEEVTELEVQPIEWSPNLLEKTKDYRSPERAGAAPQKSPEVSPPDGRRADDPPLHLFVHDATAGVVDKNGIMQQLPITDFGMGAFYRDSSKMTVVGMGSDKLWDAVGRGQLDQLKFSAVQQVICISKLRSLVADSLRDDEKSTSATSFDSNARRISLELNPARARELDFTSLFRSSADVKFINEPQFNGSIAFAFSQDSKVESIEVILKDALKEDGSIDYLFRLRSNGLAALRDLSPEQRAMLELPSKK